MKTLRITLSLFSILLLPHFTNADLLDFFKGPLLLPIQKGVQFNFDAKRFFDENELAKKNNSFTFVNPNDIKENFESVILDPKIKRTFKLIVSYIKNPEQFKKIGVKPPKGILLYGPPGTGKTSLARALAKHANCKFIFISGSEVDSKWVGDGKEKIKEIFEVARKNAPAIIFFDEIDTIAKTRMSDEKRFETQTVQQLLSEIDGFIQNNKPIIILGTTNNLDHLDKALLRSGRFDMLLEIPLPNQEQQKKIFLKNIKNIKKTDSINPKSIEEICKNLGEFSGADIENAVNKAGLIAIEKGKQSVELIDLKTAIQEIQEQKNKIN